MDPLRLFRNDEDAEFYPAGETIFEAGDVGEYMYVVNQGEVEVVLNGRVIETVEAGGILGEMALIDNSPRSAAAVAKTDCRLFPLNRRRFTFLIQEHPFFALHVMSIMAERLRRQTV